MQRLYLFLIILGITVRADAQPIPKISFRQLDSIIATKPQMAMCYFGTWCASGSALVPPMLALFQHKPNMPLLLIGDPYSDAGKLRALQSKSPAHVRVYQMRPVALNLISTRRLIKINDMRQAKLFNAHFIPGRVRNRNLKFPVFYLVNNRKEVLYVNQGLLNSDSVYVHTRAYL